MKGAAGWRRRASERERERDLHNSGIFWPDCLPVLSCYYRPQHSTIFIFSLAATMKGIFTRIFHTFSKGIGLFKWSGNFGFQIFLNRLENIRLILADFDFIAVLSTIRLGETEVRQSWTSVRHPGPC